MKRNRANQGTPSYRVFREGLYDTVIFEQRLMELREQTVPLSRKKENQAEGTASAKAPRWKLAWRGQAINGKKARAE